MTTKDSELTDAEIDTLLERFDQTEPQLQRRIVASLISEIALRDEQLQKTQAALTACKRIKEYRDLPLGSVLELEAIQKLIDLAVD